MDGKELKRLSRRELLEILLEQARRIEDLEIEVDSLNEKLNSKKIAINEVGTLAEASLKLTKIFEEADEAIKLYKENIELLAKEEEKKQKKEYRKKKNKMLEATEKKCRKLEAQAEKKIKELEESKTKVQTSKKKTSKKKKEAK